MAEWLIERGLGETRAALVEAGRIVEARIARGGDGVPRAGDVWTGRLIRRGAGGRAFVSLGDYEGVAERVPAAICEGALLRAQVLREAIPERGRPRLAKLRALGPAADGIGRISRGPDLEQEIAGGGAPVSVVAGHGDDRLEEAGWSELLDAARSGCSAFEGGLLTLSPAPAMTLIDVDGDLAAGELAIAGARAAAAAIRRFDIGGSIGVDLPTAGARDIRRAAASAFDAALPQPFERTAVNGFGFIQIVRPRRRPSLLELMQNDAAAAAALALLRQAEHSPGAGPRRLAAHPAVATWLGERPALLDELARRIGAGTALTVEPGLPLWGGHVTAAQN